MSGNKIMFPIFLNTVETKVHAVHDILEGVVSHVLNPIALRNKSHHQYSGSAYEVLL
jgi:hypothetical protein